MARRTKNELTAKELLDQNSVVNPVTGCIEMTKKKAWDGYVKVTYQGESIQAHVLSWMVAGNERPSRKIDLDHTCRVRHCINTAHLDPVPRSVNVKRGWDAGRIPPKRKLTFEDAVAIKKAVREGATQLSQALKYGISRPHVCNIMAGRMFKNA